MGIPASLVAKKKEIGVVLLAALVIESGNFFLGALALDPGPPDTRWYVNLLAIQWGILHAVGIFVMDWGASLWFPGHDAIVLFLGGYVSTVVVLAAVVFVVRRVVRWIGRPERRRRRRRSRPLL